MAVCRCDPTSTHDGGPRAGQPRVPVVFRAVVKVNGQPVASRLVLHCKRCKAVWPGE